MIGTHFLGMTIKKLISRFIEIDMRKLAQVGLTLISEWSGLMILDSKFFVFILFNVLSACFLSSVSVGFIFKALLYSFIWLFIVYYAISFIKNRFVTESLKSFILVLEIVFSCRYFWFVLFSFAFV